MIKVYLVRHGQTEGNINRFFQEPTTPLATTGLVQAKRVAKRLKKLRFDQIYSSPHIRAKQTSQEISGLTGVKIEFWNELEELRRPTEVWGIAHDDPKAVEIMQTVHKNYSVKDIKYSDEENFFDLDERATKILKHLVTHHNDQTVVCVSHGTFIKFIISKAIFGDGLTPELSNLFTAKLSSDNTGISLLQYEHEGSGWRLITWNDTSHL